MCPLLNVHKLYLSKAVGELELEGSALRLQSSPNGPMILTTATKNTILRKFEEAKSSMLFRVVVCGGISVLLITLIVRKVYRKRKQELEEKALKETLEKSRVQRRTNARRGEKEHLSDDQKCVVCITNPKEVCKNYYSSLYFSKFSSFSQMRQLINFSLHHTLFI